MNLKKQMVVIALALGVSTSLVYSQDGQPLQLRTLTPTVQGAWRTMVTPVNCQTGDPLGPPFPGLFTFNKGGTMSEYGISPGLSPALRSPGHGVWEHGQSWQDYSYSFTFYRYDASGIFIGSQKVTSALELGASGDEFTTRSVVEVFDANGNLIATFCARAAGTRFE